MFPLLFFNMHIGLYQGRTVHKKIQEETVTWAKLKDDGKASFDSETGEYLE
jgi:hypothetical protein